MAKPSGTLALQGRSLLLLLLLLLLLSLAPTTAVAEHGHPVSDTPPPPAFLRLLSRHRQNVSEPVLVPSSVPAVEKLSKQQQQDKPSLARPSVRQLERQVEALFGDAGFDDRATDRQTQRKKVQVKTAWSGTTMTTLARAFTHRHKPDDFKQILVDFADTFPEINPMCKSNTVLDAPSSTDERQAVRAHLKFPFPLQDRVMFHWKYLLLNRNGRIGVDKRDISDNHEHMLIISENGNGDLLKQYYHGTDDESNKVLARTFLCAYWIRPVYDSIDESKIVGTEIRYCFSGDTGGSIPPAIQNAVGPKTASDSVKGIIQLAK